MNIQSFPSEAFISLTIIATFVISSWAYLDGYDKYKRPNFGTGKTDYCNFTVVIYKIGPTSENSMTMKTEMYLRQRWKDHRLLPYYYNESILADFDPDDFVTIIENGGHDIWYPNIYFSDSVSEDTPDEISVSSFTRLFPDGTVFSSRRAIVETRCEFNLKFFPMDNQHCLICMESYQLDDSEQTIQWADEGESVFLLNTETAVFNVEERVQLITDVKQYPNLASRFTSLCMKVRLQRKLPIYLVTMYLPSMALVGLSWVAFWLDKDATNARGGLAITTILSQVTLMTGTANRFPQVSHVKLGDIYMMVNFFFVFGTLIQFAIVNKQQSNLTKISQQQKKPNQDVPKQLRSGCIDNVVSMGVSNDASQEEEEVTEPRRGWVANVLWIIVSKDVDDISKRLFIGAFLIWNLIYFLYGTVLA